MAYSGILKRSLYVLLKCSGSALVIHYKPFDIIFGECFSVLPVKAIRFSTCCAQTETRNMAGTILEEIMQNA